MAAAGSVWEVGVRDVDGGELTAVSKPVSEPLSFCFSSPVVEVGRRNKSLRRGLCKQLLCVSLGLL